MREEEAHQGDRGESDSSKEQDRDVIVEEEQESGPTGAEAPGPPTSMASVHAAEPSMDVDLEDVPPLTSEEVTAVTPEEDEVLQLILPHWLERWPSYKSPLQTARSPRTVKPHNRSCPPLCVNEVLDLSPLNNLRGSQHEPSE